MFVRSQEAFSVIDYNCLSFYFSYSFAVLAIIYFVVTFLGGRAKYHLFIKNKTVAYYSISYLFYADSKLLRGQHRGRSVGRNYN
jgi:hypothetical protein